MSRPARALAGLPAPAIYVLSGVSQYTGSAIGVAVLLAAMPGHAAAWWRVAVGAVVLCAWRRPRVHALSRRDLVTAAVFGLFITGMNMAFYEAIARIPLGTAVSVEFVGPVATALILGGGWRARLGAVATALGVVAIGGLGLDLTDPTQAIGLAWAGAAGAAWAGYIILGTRIAHRAGGIDTLAIGLAAGAVLTLPTAWGHLGALAVPRLALAIVAVGVLASALPFPLEQLAMRRLGPDLVSLMSAVLPATSVVIGAALLHQVPTWGEAGGIVLISAGIALAYANPRALTQLRRARRDEDPKRHG